MAHADPVPDRGGRQAVRPSAPPAPVPEGGTSSAASGAGRRSRLADPRSWGPVTALALLVVVLTLANERFLTLANVRTIADQSAIPLILATGMTFVILMGAIDLSIEGVMAATSMSVALLVENSRTGLELGPAGVVLAVSAGAVFGLANGVAHTRLRVPSFMVTLGTWFVGLGLAALLFGGRPPRVMDTAFRQWTIGTFGGFTRLVAVALVVLAIGYLVQRQTRLGRYAYVIGGAEDLARLSGVAVARYKTYVFGVAGATSGLGGVLLAARQGVGSPTAGAGQLFTTIAAVVVGGTLLSGGRGGVLQSVVGVLLITVLGNGMILAGIDPSIQQAVQGVIIVVAVVTTTWSARRRLRVIK